VFQAEGRATAKALIQEASVFVVEAVRDKWAEVEEVMEGGGGALALQLRFSTRRAEGSGQSSDKCLFGYNVDV
jgi:hypothetical protein